MKTTVTITGHKELQRRLNRMEQGARGAALAEAARAGGEVIRRQAISRAPGPHIVQETTKATGTRAEVAIGPDNEHWYYRFAETGAQEHEITPSIRAALAFEGETGPVVIGSVGHPGIRATPFLRPAVDGRERAIENAMGDQLYRSTRGR